MTREQELEKVLQWAGAHLWKVELNFSTEKMEMLYTDVDNRVERSVGDSLEECIRKAMQQEGEL